MISESPTIQPLRELGLTALEAEIYAFLASGDSATGYRVAREIDRPTANTYKALESLRSKGAVVVEDGARRLYRAVTPGELLRTLERRFTASKERAAEALANLGRPILDDGVYRLRSTDQVVERLGDILSRAERTVLGRMPARIAARVHTAGELRFAMKKKALRGNMGGFLCQ